MNIFSNFCFHFGGVLGKCTLNPEVLKCHEDLITLDTYVQQGETMDNKAIRDGRPRPPRHQGFIAISYGGSELRHRSILETITHRPKCQIQKL